MHGSFNKGWPIEVIQTKSTTISWSNMGISAVVPAYKLHEILFGEELVTQRGD
jgi:hypothetical protein